MSAEIQLRPLDEHGVELLDALERRSEVLPFKVNTRTGARAYSLASSAPDESVLVLNTIDPDWREHLDARKGG